MTPCGWAMALVALGVCRASAAPAPAPDFSGVWMHSPGTAIRSGAAHKSAGEAAKGVVGGTGEFRRALSYTLDDRPVPLQPWAAAIVKQYSDAAAANKPLADPVTLCLPSGTPIFLTQPYPYQIVQTPKQITIISEANQEIRFIYMNQGHPANLKPAPFGNSVGHWEDGTLVVDTIGQTDKTLFATVGVPHTKALHVVERFRLSKDGNQLEDLITIDDPGTFTNSWQTLWRLNRRPDVRLLEYICADGDQDQNEMTHGPTTRP